MSVRVSRASSVIVHRVPPAMAERFVALQDSLTATVEAFAGYQGTDVYPPADPTGNEWVVVIHFADADSLQLWLNAPVRTEWVKKVRQEVGDFRLETLPTGFGSWFVGRKNEADSKLPPGWKMVVIVLLGLYPTVLLLTLTVGPVTAPLGLAIAMLIGNALSVSILQYAVMPILTRIFGLWLHANASAQRLTSAAGLGVILLLLGGLTVLFRQITG
jgi:uncharacterized protein